MRFLTLLGLSLVLVVAHAEDPRLNFQLVTNCDQTPIIAWKLMSAPPTSAAGGTGSIPIICYSGPAYVLSAEGLGTKAMLIEASTNLSIWQPFPAPAFQLTFYSTSAPFINIPEDSALFFRGVIATNQP
jgi:hypothetical protein